MKLEDLLEMSADQLEKMTDKELEEWCKPFFDVTRPDRVRAIKAKNPNHNKSNSSSKNYMPPAKRKALDALLGLGIDLSDVKGFKRK